MDTAAAISPSRYTCAHCGLLIAATSPPSGGAADLYCCHACRLAAFIIGKREEGDRSWNLLRLGIGTLLAMNVMMISLLLYTGAVEVRTVPIFRLILLGLAAPALVILIPPFVAGAGREVRAGRMSLDTLIAGGSLSAFAVSAHNALTGRGEIYFDTATMLPVLVTVGKLLEASAKSRAADLLHSLESLLPSKSLRETAGGVEEVGIDLLQRGDRVRVRPGERIPVDGKIVEGTGNVEEAAFTGEFLPRLCTAGDAVIAGTVNGSGSILVEAEKTGTDLLLNGIIRMIQDAWQKPSGAELTAERAARLFIPAVLVIAAGSVLCWAVAGNVTQGFLSALSVLVVACPCTMGIATPLATSLAIARAGKAGVIVRGGRVMEEIAGIRLIFFDKTGTITTGAATVKEVVRFDPSLDENELLGRLAALESGSEHALGRAVLAEAARRGIEAGSATGVCVIPGSGITGVVTWRGTAKTVTAGSEAFVTGEAGPQPLQENRTMIDLAWDGKLRGRLLLSDTLREDAAGCVNELTRQGISSVLLSGDRFPAASAVAAQVGIEEVCAPRTPAQKLETISTAAGSERAVAMVGDGINDAPALAAARTGIALGAGMDLAKHAGNVIILSGHLRQIPWLIDLSRRTGKIIRANFAWSFAYNSIALATAAAGLLHPLLAAILMVVSSITVLGNSMRIAAFPDHS